MGTVFRTRNLRVVIRPKDHQPPHVHVHGPDAEAKFVIGTWECESSRGFSNRALLEIRDYLSDKAEALMEAWHENQKD